METNLQSMLEFINIMTSGDISVIQSACQLFYDTVCVCVCVCARARACDKPRFIDLEMEKIKKIILIYRIF